MSACIVCGSPAATIDGVAHLRCQACIDGLPALPPDALHTEIQSTRCTCGRSGAQHVVIDGATYMHPLCVDCAETGGADEAGLMDYPIYRALKKIRVKDTE